MRTTRSVLISGAGVAGLTLANRLSHHGFTVTVVELAPKPRATGQAIDVRGVALDVVDRMGLLSDVRRLRTRMRGMSWLDGAGNEQWRSEEFVLSSGPLDGDDIEILRDDLTGPIHDVTPVEYLYGDSIAGLRQDGSGITVTFEHGPARRFDLVVGADGLYSVTRRLAFGQDVDPILHLGAYLGVFSGRNELGLDNWQLWVEDGGTNVVMYPARDNTELRFTVGFVSPPLAVHHRDVPRHKELIAEHVAGMPYVRDLLQESLEAAEDFTFGAMAQVRLDRWSRGRVAVIGDAGACASPLAGQGTSLALVQAHVLAEELAAHDGDHGPAYARYEQRLRPFVALNQALATERPGRPASQESLERAKNAIALDESG